MVQSKDHSNSTKHTFKKQILIPILILELNLPRAPYQGWLGSLIEDLGEIGKWPFGDKSLSFIVLIYVFLKFLLSFQFLVKYLCSKVKKKKHKKLSVNHRDISCLAIGVFTAVSSLGLFISFLIVLLLPFKPDLTLAFEN